MADKDLKDIVKAKYGQAALRVTSGGNACCGSAPSRGECDPITSNLYDAGETAGAITLFGTALGGIPVSTTHTITGAIMGVGAIQRFSAVRWGVAGRIVWAWVLTIPASALVAGVAWLLIHQLAA